MLTAYYETAAFGMRLMRAGFNDLANIIFRLAWALKPRIAGEVDCDYPHDTDSLMTGHACPSCKGIV